MEIRVVRRPEELEELADGWDAMLPGRGPQADPYDSAAWLGAWAAADPDGARHLLAPVALDEGGAVLAALPLVVDGGTAAPAGGRWRPRFRAPCAGETLAQDVAGQLVEAALEAGVRRFDLPAMPSRDPASASLRDALSGAGLHVQQHDGNADCLCLAGPTWDGHRKAFKKYDRTVKNFSNKAARLGEVELLAWTGASDGFPEQAWRAYLDLHGLGWKGALREPMRSHRHALFGRMARRGWLNVFCLAVSGVRAATIVWLRVGTAAIAYSTVYDERLAALSAGTIVMWRAHESLYAEGPVELFDYLPGHGPQKDQLATERPVLWNLGAARRAIVPVSGLGSQVRRAASRIKRAVESRRPNGAKPEASGTSGAPGEKVSGRFPYPPDGEPGLAGGPPAVAELGPDPVSELYLCIACGFTSPKRQRETWLEGDVWYALDDPPRVLVRLGASDAGSCRPVRELVLVGDDIAPEAALAAFASGLRSPIVTAAEAGCGEPSPVPVHRAPLPWPAGQNA